MLAALRADRFKLFKEPDLIVLGIPYELRRSTQDAALAARKLRPFNPKHSPIMTPAARCYRETVEHAKTQSRYVYNRLKELHAEYIELEQQTKLERSIFDKPIPSLYGVQDAIDTERRKLGDFHKSCIVAWDALTWEETQWFRDIPPTTRWAWDFPGEAPDPQRWYPLEETPERERQFHLLEWVLRDCGSGF